MPVAKLALKIATKESVMLYCLKYSCLMLHLNHMWLYNQRYKRRGIMSSCCMKERKCGIEAS